MKECTNQQKITGYIVMPKDKRMNPWPIIRKIAKQCNSYMFESIKEIKNENT